MTTQIFEQVLKKDENNNVISKFAIMINLDINQLNKDLAKYCDNIPCNLFVDIKLNNPWTRVIISGINDLKYLTNDQKLRLEKITKLNNLK